MTRALIAGGLALIALAGCSTPIEAPTRASIEPIAAAPGAPAQADFFPLEVGNRWWYVRESRIDIIPADGGTPEIIIENSASEREILCVDPRDGVEYHATRVTEAGPGGTLMSWIRYRQSAAGLFVLGTDTNVPPACAAGGGPAHVAAPRPTRSDAREAFLATRPGAEQAAYRRALARLDERRAMIQTSIIAAPAAFLPGAARPGEGTQLRYPLTPKRSWLVYADLRFRIAAHVEGFDMLVLQPGPLECHRIRLVVPGFGADDRAHVWYGPAGYLQSEVHFSATVFDVEGNPYGRVTSDVRERLVQMSLIDR
jgi:hypothetical protein